MYEKKILGLAEAEVAVKAVLQEASKDPNRPIAVAVADSLGDIIMLCRMDRATAFFNQAASAKAYTSGFRGLNTRKYFELRASKERCGEWGLVEPAGTGFTYIPGGVTIVEPGTPVEQTPTHRPEQSSYGGIGVSGRSQDEDEALATVGLKALQAFLWPSET